MRESTRAAVQFSEDADVVQIVVREIAVVGPVLVELGLGCCFVFVLVLL